MNLQRKQFLCALSALALAVATLTGCDISWGGEVNCATFAIGSFDWHADFEGRAFLFGEGGDPGDTSFSQGYARYGKSSCESSSSLTVETSVLQARWSSASGQFVGCDTAYASGGNGYAITSGICAPSESVWSINSVRAWQGSTYYDTSYDNLRCDAPNCHLPPGW